MSVGGTIFAAMYDRLMQKAEKAGLTERRERLLADLSGRVLEIGGGTGANLARYGGGVTALTVVEPEEAMARRLERKARDGGHQVELVNAPAEKLPFEDGQFDVARLDARPLHGRRPAARARGASPRPQARRTAALHRARPCGDAEARPLAGPPQRSQPGHRGRVQLQPDDARRHSGRRVHRHGRRARGAAEGAALRSPVDRGDRRHERSLRSGRLPDSPRWRRRGGRATILR
jgi:SAM-dependent methyltransferase